MQKLIKKPHKRKLTLVFAPPNTNKSDPSRAKKKRVAAYARVSTELDSQKNSYEAQIAYYSDFINKNPAWEFVEVYADEGVSGTNYKNRTELNRMLVDAISGRIDLILTKSISRFARNTVDALTLTRNLTQTGIEVFVEKENISSMDSSAELIFTIMSSIAQEESRSLSENIRWRIERNMEAGKITLPYKSFLGYDRGPDGLPKINEHEAKIVRRIYRDYLAGASLRMIASSLTAEGIKAPRGGDKWSPETVRNILTNEKYKGDARLQKTYTVDFLSKEVRKNHGERKQYYIKDSHDAIISEKIFEKVQLELPRRKLKH